ncbi:uncharacterized protein LOC120705627 [Panicum virgatum]|uniref:Uncharacterized protein n=1 Tax=Panicum virgatum TaxID=38727 RepID=A0A8T0SCV4_PANVG|nr:uncharacterized protein LOC120705627 [Panicum virgatum]KAG2594945.1 hypothetical protein PVAP13_5KG039900 [Panicum virgatum]
MISSRIDCQPWPKGKRLPKDAPEGSTQSLMGAIERGLRNASNRKGRYIFEPSPGMTFDCVSEAQGFCNIYSWEVGFGCRSSEGSACRQNANASCTEYVSSTETDCESMRNMYGAAGSSVGLSDSELLSLRPPDVKMRRDGQRMNLYKTRNDIIRERLKQAGRKVSKKKKNK